MFLSADLKISGKAVIDEALNLQFSDLSCRGSGAIASLACGVIDPQLQKMQCREISLLALPLGEIRLRDVTVSIAERVTVAAEFGA